MTRSSGIPKVSIVIPAFNAARFLPDSIGSVLSQTFDDWECIVVDDGSTDETVDVVRSYPDPRLHYVHKPNRGTVADARNAGIAAARGEFIALLDADDMWLPTKLERQLGLYRQHPDLGLVYCAYAIADANLQPHTVIWPFEHDPKFERWLLLEGNGIAPSSTSLIRSDVFSAVGRYRLDLSVSEDLDLAQRIAAAFAVAAVDECLVLYRSHGAQGHTRLDAFEHDMTWILADRFGPAGTRDRRRWRRGTSNLHTRLFVYRLIAREGAAARRHLMLALSNGPHRLVCLPAEAVIRRLRRKVRSWRSKTGRTRLR